MCIKAITYFFILFFSLSPLSAYSGVILSSTRVIFNGNRAEATVSVTNPDKKSYLIQSWVSLDDKKSSEFVVTPPLFRIDGDMSNVLRIVLAKNNLPQNKESLFWLNVKAIPPSDPNAKDTLLIAINTKIKLIYRPTDLMGKEANNAYQKLTFRIDSQTQELVASNPTPYYINLASLTYNNKKIETPGIVAPFSSVKWAIKTASSNHSVSWSAINDFGGITSNESQIVN